MLIKEPINEIFLPNPLESVKEITKRYLDTIQYMGYFPKDNHIRHRRITLPKSLDHLRTIEEKEERLKEYLRRWKHGYENLNGTMYSYYNYTVIKARAAGGAIRPEYREYTNKTFELIESCLYGKSNYFGDNTGKGIVFLSKRGLGKSAECGHAINTVVAVNKEVTCLLTSKDEPAGQGFLADKVKFNFYRYPGYLRNSEVENNRDVYHIGKKTKDKDGNTIILGNDSRIVSRAPTPEAIESYGAKLWVHDESGKTKYLLQLCDNGLPALNGKDGITRVGVPIFTGVAGDFDKFGTDYIELWNDAEIRNFLKWFVPGFVGIHVDEFGNDDVERAVYEIFKERYRLYGYNNDQLLQEHIQKAPLTPEEALQSTNTSLFNKTKIFQQSKTLAYENDYLRGGDLEWDSNHSNITFRPNSKNGKIKFLETPQAEALSNRQYIAFIDAYGKQQKQTEGSGGALYIFKRKTRLNDYQQEELDAQLEKAVTLRERLDIHLRMGFMPVCEYLDNPDDPRVFAEYAYRVITWYGSCKTLVEREPQLIFMWFLDNAKHVLQRKPLKHHEFTIDFKEWGLKVDEYWKDKRRSFLQNYIEDNCNRIYFPKLLLDASIYDDTVQKKKKDSVDGFGGCLIHDSQSKLLQDSETFMQNTQRKLYGVVRNKNGFSKSN